MHGAGDDNVYVINGDLLYGALHAAGTDIEYVRIEGLDGLCHGGCWQLPEAREALHAFLATRLIAGRRPVAATPIRSLR